MFSLIPIIGFGLLWLGFANRRPLRGWRRSFLDASIAWGVFAILLTEFLSLFKAVTLPGLALGWAGLALAGAARLVLVWRDSGRMELPALRLPPRRSDRLLIAVIGLVLILVGVVAWLAPPQTWDSLTYHMSRVAHWAQNHSVASYATGVEFQNLMSESAEFLVLQFYILTGGDRLVNFVQWFAMLGCAIGASVIAEQLGGSLSGQALAAAFAAALPMGIAQASSTTTDYGLAFWMVCVALKGLELIRAPREWETPLWLGVSTGMALATKPTAFAFMLPFAVWIALELIRRVRLREFIRAAASVGCLTLALNAGHTLRNVELYSSWLGPSSVISGHTNEVFGWKVVASNLVRDASLHLGTQSPEFNQWLQKQILKIHVKIGQDWQDPRTTQTDFRIIPPSTQEDTTPNQAAAILISLVFVGGLVFARRLGRQGILYMLVVASTFVVFAGLLKYQIFGSRLQLPFFVLFAPSVGLAFSGRLSRVAPWLGMLLILLAYPWILSNQTRPLVPLRPWTQQRSLMSLPRDEFRDQSQPYDEMTTMILDRGCDSVGLMISGAADEYTLWQLLGAPRPSLRLEWIVGGNPSARLEPPDFHPCAVICENCPSGWVTVRGLPIVYRWMGSRYALFAG